MVFNWFRRQFDRDDRQEDESTQPPVEDTQETVEETGEEAEEAEETAAEADPAQNYLAWAKAAYQNIQKQQPTQLEVSEEVSEEPAEAVTEEVSEEPAEAVTEEVSEEPAEAVTEEVSEEPAEAVSGVEAVTEEVSEEISEIQETTETISEEAAETEVEPVFQEVSEEVSEVEETQPEPVSEEVSEVEETRPEPVSEEVSEVEETQPEPVSETNVPAWAKAAEERKERLDRLKAEAIETPVEEEPTPEPTPAIAFDEDFVWSAEVLAAQGRRPDEVSIEEITWLQKLRQGLGKTRLGLINQLKAIVGQGPLNKDAVFEIEALLLQADVGVEATDKIIETLQAKLREESLPPEEAIAYLKQILRDILDRPFENGYDREFTPEKDHFNIWLMTGVNGAGKTTTIGKLAHLAKKSDYSCIIAAADTFRAAAVEQVKIWGQRSETEVIANPGKNTDPAAVVFDGITAAKSRDVELLLVDTAGRLQNKKNLMDELSKIRRIIDKKASDAKVESLLVLDATLGQNGLRQAQVFAEAAKLSGVVLTKLDGTAKGGVALAVVEQLGLPIRFVGAGEGIEDLRPFSSYEFVEALLNG
ncbi:signal recognition particle-docking protein FtsY [Baaleninema simplex]|uniref:signal recognition particle-docking protein FtsY n=1 Tax=Baaleninema simplex TaxID=2862350 RepID=UPI0003491363|nr:signal recognition particle-docking protein FtsY [Baaleninema simplex]